MQFIWDEIARLDRQVHTEPRPVREVEMRASLEALRWAMMPAASFAPSADLADKGEVGC